MLVVTSLDTMGYWGRHKHNTSQLNKANADTLLEGIAKEWKREGYDMPHLIFWNVDARQANVPMIGNGRVSYVSGFSPSIFQTIMTGKTGYDLMMECLNGERYAAIQ